VTRRLRVAFVGVRRPPSDVPAGYWPTFVQYHLELPFYYAAHAPIDVDLTTIEPVEYTAEFNHAGSLRCLTEEQYRNARVRYDVVVHWRRWYEDLADPLARNVILSQDHSYGPDWLYEVRSAFEGDRLDGILVFPTWHRERVAAELKGVVPVQRLYEGMTFGVDTSVYRPGRKDPFHLLWASDPGRGLENLIAPFLHLWGRDRRFRLTVTYPDYVRPEAVARFSSFLRHPGVTHAPSVRNGVRLWDLFNDSGVLPYSSNFPEPSSRCHRQAMAAGSLVLYPPNMGTPSCLLEDGLTGVVDHPDTWPDIICDMVSTGRWEELGHNARSLAVNENWAVQAGRFHSFFSKGLE
jgi:hypothetical protein